MSEQSQAQFRSLNDVWLAIQALVGLLAVAILMQYWSLPKLLKWLDNQQNFRSTDCPLPQNLLQLIMCLNGWLRRSRVNERPCLYRSLVLFSYLRRKGFAVNFHLGLRTDIEPWEGHAWLQYGDAAIADTSSFDENAMKTTYSYPPQESD